jgi:two-component system, OmpR family, response regulator
MRVLVVEDDAKLAALLQRALREQGMLADAAGDGEDALWMADATPYDVIVLDVNLPGIDGFETCQRLRASQVRAPVLMLTARAAVDDRVTGLDIGADDYLVKPFAIGELFARIRALARRGPVTRGPVLIVGDLSLDAARRAVFRGSTEIALSAKEFQLLEVFMRWPGQVLSRYDLLEGAWDMAYENRSNVVDVYVRYLREKIDRPFGIRTIETVRGTGYRLRAPGQRLRPRQRDAGVGAPLGQVAHRGLTAMRGGDGLDKRQPQAAALTSRLRPPPASKTLECGRDHVLGEAVAFVGDVQPEQPAFLPGDQPDQAFAILQRIGDEVIERLRQAVGITEQRGARRAVVNHDRPPACPGRGPCPGRGRLKQHARPQWPRAQRKVPVVRPREHQDVVREPGDPADFLSRRPECRPELTGIPVSEQRELHLRPQRGQRGPQLVACVTQQPPLVCHRPAGAARHAAKCTVERPDSSGSRHRHLKRGLIRRLNSAAGSVIAKTYCRDFHGTSVAAPFRPLPERDVRFSSIICRGTVVSSNQRPPNGRFTGMIWSLE